MEKTTDYAKLLQITYSEYNTALTTDGEGEFRFVIRNPERADGDITVIREEGNFRLLFFSMDEDLGDDFGELVAFTDELLADESMIFELLSEGEYVLGGSRGTEVLGKYRGKIATVNELADGDLDLRFEILSYLEKGNCALRLRGWYAKRCFSVILEK